MDVEFLISAFNSSQYPAPDRPEIAFAGRSNVGKSSLINVLVNRKKIARTSSTPGRTQSVNFFRVGSSRYLVDLPGYGFAKVPVKVKESWRGMVESYLASRSNLRAVVVILDIRRTPSQGDSGTPRVAAALRDTRAHRPHQGGQTEPPAGGHPGAAHRRRGRRLIPLRPGRVLGQDEAGPG